ncbi:CsgG/HfaB family protein [Stieleria varia]|uniref:Curli production assembly/transport component CsgG n=1 Tax=Stieleria varia TaxID=2528005 RepID=A0A5C6B8B8_9BACT|nr:CsgG/HfaB family protein [Stieleria varia]TWU08208.1 Curli production assembly/transport component CsgG [Stieleria varia]
MRFTAAGAFLLSVAFGCSLLADDARRWAVLSMDDQAQDVADLLTAELFQTESIQLVERADIELILNELKLSESGLTSSDQMLRVGNMSQADALLLLSASQENESSESDSESPKLRVRLVDSRTSIRLLDRLYVSSGGQFDIDQVTRDLQQSSSKLSLPADELQLISLMSIKSGEPGDTLTGFCHSMTTLVESGLFRVPNVIVLERSELTRLRQESRTSGLDLKLRASTRLLEISIRRDASREGTRPRILATCRIHSFDSGPVSTFEVDVPTDDATAVRSAIIESVLKRINSSEVVSSTVTAEQEAKEFDRRRRWLEKAYRPKEAAEMAEAALALAPTRDRIVAAIRNYSIWRHHYTNRSELPPEMPRYDELRFQLRELDQQKDKDTVKTDLSVVNQLYSYVGSPIAVGSEKDKSIRRGLRVEAQRGLANLQKAAADDPREMYQVLLDKLALLSVLSESEQQYVQQLPDVIAEVLQARKAASIEQDMLNPHYARLVMVSLSAIRKGLSIARGPIGREDQNSEWKERGFQRLNSILQQDEELALRVAKLTLDPLGINTRGAKRVEPDELVIATDELLCMIQSWEVPPPPQTRAFNDLPKDEHVRRAWFRRNNPDTYRFVEYLSREALGKIRTPEQRAGLLDRFLVRSELSGDPAELIAHRQTLQNVFVFCAPSEKLALAERIFNQLDRASSADEIEARSFRRQITKNLQGSQLLERESFSLRDASGVWQEYQTKKIVLSDIPPQNNQLLWLDIDQNADSGPGGEIVMGWSRKGNMSIERVGFGGGRPVKFGPDVPGTPQPFQPPMIAYGPEAMYIATNSAGFTILRANSIERVTQQEGAPSDSVLRLAWYRDRLFVAFRDAFAVYHPEKKTFELLASSLSIEPKNEIDGRGSFFITSLIPDETNGSLWMTIQDNAVPRDRNGFWRYQPKQNRFEKLSGSNVMQAHTDDRIFLRRSSQPMWAVVVKATGQLTDLEHYYQADPGPSLAYHRFVVDGDRIIGDTGSLLTPDGKQSKLPLDKNFRHLLRASQGIIADYDEREKVIWMLQRR